MKTLEIQPQEVKYSYPSRQTRDLDYRLYRFLSSGAKTRPQMVERLETPRTTIYDRLRLFIRLGWMVKYHHRPEERIRGRPRVLFALTELGQVEFKRSFDEKDR